MELCLRVGVYLHPPGYREKELAPQPKKENGFLGHLVLIPKNHPSDQQSPHASIRYDTSEKRFVFCVDAFLSCDNSG